MTKSLENQVLPNMGFRRGTHKHSVNYVKNEESREGEIKEKEIYSPASESAMALASYSFGGIKEAFKYVGKKIKKAAQIGVFTLWSLGALVGCDQCNPYVNTPAVFEFTAENSEIKVDNAGKLKYNITDKDGIAYLEVEADYNGDGSVSDSEKNTINDYTEGTNATFTTRNLPKTGPLEFKITSFDNNGGNDSAKTSINVVDYPVPDLSSVSFDVTQGKSVVISLPSVAGVTYTGISVTSGASKISNIGLNQNEREVTLEASNDITQDTEFITELNWQYENGKVGKATKTGKIKNLWDIYLNLESNESHGVGEAGRIKAYDPDTGQELVVVDTPDGNAHLQLPSPDVKKVMLQGKLTRDSYYRKKIFEGIGENGELVDIPASQNFKYRIVPAPDFYVDPSNPHICTKFEFRDAMETINMPTYIRPEDGKEVGLWKADVDNWKGFEALLNNPDSAKGAYTLTQQNAIKSIIQSQDGIKKCLGYKTLNDSVQIDDLNSIKHYTINESGLILDVEEEYAIFVPDSTRNGGATDLGYKDNSYLTGIVNKARITTGTDEGGVSSTIGNHEIGHIFLAINGAHMPYIFRNVSLMGSSGPLTTFKNAWADIKSGYLIYEDTYEAREPSKHLLALTEGI